jgi:hypothetical protein
MGEDDDVHQGDIPFASLDVPYVGAVDAGAVRELFLGDAELISALSDRFTYGPLQRFFLRFAQGLCSWRSDRPTFSPCRL